MVNGSLYTNISLPPVFVEMKHFEKLIDDYKPRPSYGRIGIRSSDMAQGGISLINIFMNSKWNVLSHPYIGMNNRFYGKTIVFGLSRKYE